MEFSDIHVPKGIEGLHDLWFDHCPRYWEKADGEPIRPWRLVRGERADDVVHFFLGESLRQLK
jgi:hypothetical protein